MPNKLAHEVAKASLHNGPIGVIRPTYPNILVDVAKRLQRLQTRRAKLRKDLRKLESDIRLEKQHLKALASAVGRGE